MDIFNKKLILVVLFVVVWQLIFFDLSFVSASNGTIDSVYRYAWGENIGWINFGCSNCNVQVTDSGITGYAWSPDYGWINLNPTTAGVKNDGKGNLSGYAWGRQLGWINFSGVTINNGEFSGYATVLNDSSKISFNCSNNNSCNQSDFKVKTNWRPQIANGINRNSYNGGSSQSQVKNLLEMGNKKYARKLIREYPTLYTEDYIKNHYPHLFTQKELDFIFSSLNGKTHLSSTTTTTTTTPIPTPPVSIVPVKCSPYLVKPIKYGANNDHLEVKKLQSFLNKYEGEQSKITGIYDESALKAVKRFQKKYASDILLPWNITVPTGFVYKTTIKKINAIYCERNLPKENITAKTTTSCPYFVQYLKFGDINSEVKKVQQFLKERGFFPQSQETTNYFGPITLKAVKQFQAKYSQEILKPWNVTTPTGYWYRTTIKQANEMMGCQ